MALRGPDPALLGQDHRHRFRGHQLGLVHGPGFFTLFQGRAPRIAELFHVGPDFLLHLVLQAGGRTQYLLQGLPFFLQLVQFAPYLYLLQLGQAPQPEVENGLRLGVGQVEAPHQLPLGIVLLAHDPDHLVDVQVGDHQAFQDVQALFHLLQPVLQAPAHRLGAVLQPFLQDGLQVLDPGPPVDADHVQVDPVTALQVRGGEQVRHQFRQVHPVRARDKHQPGRVFMVGFIAQVLQHRQFLRLHLRGHLFQNLVAGRLVGQRGHDDVAALLLPPGPQFHGTGTAAIDFLDFMGRRDDFRLGGEVGAFDMLEQVLNRAPGPLQQADTGAGHFPQVVGRDVRRHAHGNARGAVQQDIGQARRQQLRLLQGAVEIGYPVGGALPQLRQQRLAVGFEPGFRVAHGRKRLGIVHGTPVPLAVDDGIAVTEVLGHQHHGLVAGAVPVGVELADDVAHRARRFLELGGRAQPQFRHGVDDAPLYRLQPVADMRQRPVQDDIHRVIQVCSFGEFVQRLGFVLLEIQDEIFRHCVSLSIP